MITADKHRLIDFMEKNGLKNGAVTDLFDDLANFYLTAKTGEFLLSACSDIHQEIVKRDLLDIGKPIDKVITVPLTQHPYPKPEWMSQRAYEESLLLSLGKTYWIGSDAKYSHAFKNAFGSAPLHHFHEAFNSFLWNDLSVSFKSNLRQAFGNGVGIAIEDHVVENLRSSIFYYLGYSMLNNEEEIAKLRPQVKLWSYCWTLGFKNDEPETLIVIGRPD